jgi:hypothetical protein
MLEFIKNYTLSQLPSSVTIQKILFKERTEIHGLHLLNGKSPAQYRALLKINNLLI